MCSPISLVKKSPIRPPSKGATYASVCPGSWDPQAPPGAASPACHRLETD